MFAFGKLPAHGDFVARGLAGGERDAWDAWASAGLEQARDALGDDFETRHGEAPPWRFAFGPGPWGEGWRAGALAPSIDRAGRRFVIVAGVQSPQVLAPDGTGDAIADLMEDQIYRTFEAGGDIDFLVAGARDAVDALTDPPADTPAPGRFWAADGSMSLVADQPPGDLLTRALSLQEDR